jgi:magnesium transporter
MSSNNQSSETALHLFTDKVPVIKEYHTIGDIEQLLLQNSKIFETINYIYVVDDNQHLKGVLSIKEVFRSNKEKFAKNLMHIKPVFVDTETDQEEVAYLAIKNKIKSIPVVDKQQRFLGAIPSDTILEVLHHEFTEDILRMGGIRTSGLVDDIFKLSVFQSIKHRLPWLIVGLLGGILTSVIVDGFESTLSKNLILAAFIPLIVYMADAVGAQMEAFIIRDLAFNPKLKFQRYFYRQFMIVLITAIMISLLTYIGVVLIYSEGHIASIVSLALFCAIMSSLFCGLMIPFVFSKLNLDPANASGPVATIIQDIASVTVYFAIAHLLL